MLTMIIKDQVSNQFNVEQSLQAMRLTSSQAYELREAYDVDPQSYGGDICMAAIFMQDDALYYVEYFSVDDEDIQGQTFILETRYSRLRFQRAFLFRGLKSDDSNVLALCRLIKALPTAEDTVLMRLVNTSVAAKHGEEKYFNMGLTFGKVKFDRATGKGWYPEGMTLQQFLNS